MSNLFRPRPGRRACLEGLALGVAFLCLGCNYGFRGGGGFPSHIRTLHIEVFENRTAQFELEQQLFSQLLDRLPRALGVRPAGRDAADAIVRGRIVRYDDAAQNYRAGDVGGGTQVLANQVHIGIALEIIDVRRNVILWKSENIVGTGEYVPTSQTDAEGRSLAIEKIVQAVVDGAQSQW